MPLTRSAINYIEADVQGRGQVPLFRVKDAHGGLSRKIDRFLEQCHVRTWLPLGCIILVSFCHLDSVIAGSTPINET